MEHHRDAVERYGVRLAAPTEEQLDRAKRYADAIRARLPHDRYRSNRHGQIGAELLADYFGVVAGCDPTQVDDGWDMVVPGVTCSSLIDAKTRRGLLTLQSHEVRFRAKYFALVEQEREGAPFTFCGVITPTDYARLIVNRPMTELNPGDLTHWVGANELTYQAKHFHPRQM